MAAPPPELVDELVGEILLRLPPDEPEHLFRASLVCKRWLRIVSDPAFIRRYRAFHGAPPLLALLHRLEAVDGNPLPQFTPTTAVPAFPHPGSGGRHTRPLDCRHGRVLIHMLDDGYMDYLVWDPITGDRHGLPEPHINWVAYSGAVFCAATACDHLDCHGGPFRVVILGSDARFDTLRASVYSSETRAWSKPVYLDNGHAFYAFAGNNRAFYVDARRGALIGDAIFFTIRGNTVVKFDWSKNCLSVIKPPPPEVHDSFVALMAMDDGSLGLASIEDCCLYLWSRKVNPEIAAEWVQCRVIELETMMPMAKPCDGASVVGFAEGVGVIFVSTGVGLFTIELKSGRVRKVDEPGVYYSVLPYMSFYTSGLGRLSSEARSH